MSVKFATLAALASVALLAHGAPGAEAKPSSLISCQAEGDVDISMSAKLSVRTDKNRKKFNVEFEAAPRLGYAAGQSMVVKVDGVNAGKKPLRRVLNGDFEAELELDSKSEVGHTPFPKNLVVGKGSVVTVSFKGKGTVLSCTLQ
jgi:hypothetical protein